MLRRSSNFFVVGRHRVHPVAGERRDQRAQLRRRELELRLLIARTGLCPGQSSGGG